MAKEHTHTTFQEIGFCGTETTSDCGCHGGIVQSFLDFGKLMYLAVSKRETQDRGGLRPSYIHSTHVGKEDCSQWFQRPPSGDMEHYSQAGAQ
jgi:hypothetical protein